jgi:hypothetical protein
MRGRALPGRCRGTTFAQEMSRYRIEVRRAQHFCRLQGLQYGRPISSTHRSLSDVLIDMNAAHWILRNVVAGWLSISLVATGICPCTGAEKSQVAFQRVHCDKRDQSKHVCACCGMKGCCCGANCHCKQAPQKDNNDRSLPQRSGDRDNVLALAVRTSAVHPALTIATIRRAFYSEYSLAGDHTLVALSIRINC